MIENVDKKISNTSELVNETGYNRKVTAIENKISNITDLVDTGALNAKATEIENKTLDIISLATKAALSTKAIEIKGEVTDTSCITIPECDRLTKLFFNAKQERALLQYKLRW